MLSPSINEWTVKLASALISPGKKGAECFEAKGEVARIHTDEHAMWLQMASRLRAPSDPDPHQRATQKVVVIFYFLKYIYTRIR